MDTPGVAVFVTVLVVGEDLAATRRRRPRPSTSGLEAILAGDPPVSRPELANAGKRQRITGVQTRGCSFAKSAVGPVSVVVELRLDLLIRQTASEVGEHFGETA